VLRLQAAGFQEGTPIGIELRVVVEEGITIPNSLEKRLPQLLHHPISGLECQRGHQEAEGGDDHLTMVSEEGEPVFGRIAAALQAL
jgi:hypothetical protein